MELGAPYREVNSGLLEAMGATIEQARWTIWLAKINMDDGPELVLKKVVRAVNRITTDLTSPEHAAKEIFKGLLIHYFSEVTLMILEAHKEETTHQQIQTLQRLWKSKDLYAKRRMLRNDPSLTQQTGWRRQDSGPPKDSWHARGQDQTTQHRMESRRMGRHLAAPTSYQKCWRWRSTLEWLLILFTDSGKREESPRNGAIPSSSPSLRKAIWGAVVIGMASLC